MRQAPRSSGKACNLPPGNEKPPVQRFLQHNWLSTLGASVEIRHHNSDVVHHGTVDAVTPDGCILWLQSGGPHERRMVHRSDGYTVWAFQDGETPPHCLRLVKP